MENAVNSVWVFRRLWRASSPPSLDEGVCSPSKVASSFVPSIRVNVATVVLFDDDGSPRSWLATTKDGRLRGQKLGPTSSGTRHDLWREPEERMRRAVGIIREFWERNNQRESSSAGEPFCVAWYTDGRHELLATRLVLKLSSTAKWRKHLAALQGYVAPCRVESGLYRASEDTLFGSCGNMRDGTAKVGLNMLTKAVAKWVMGAWAVESDPRCSQSQEPMSSHQLARGTQLDSMRAIFVIDVKGTLWFSHASGVQLQPPAIAGGKEASNGPSESQVLAACQLVAVELQNILGRATGTGVSMEECFSHFDSSKGGYVDSCALKKGLTTLGIGISTEVANALLLRLGGECATSFSVSDLSTFVHHGVSGSEFQGHMSERRERSRGETLAENESTPSCDVLSPVVGVPARKTQKCRVEADTQQKSKPSARPSNSYARNRQGKTQIAAPQRDGPSSAYTSPLKMLDTVDVSTPPSLPTTNHTSTRDFPQKHGWDDLPCWARQASRNALVELMGHHKRSLKRLQRESTLHSAACTSPLEVRREETEAINDTILDTDHCTSSRSRSMQEQAGFAYQENVSPSIGASLHAEWHHDRRIKVSDGDLKLHVGGGNVMSYRWIARTVSKPNHGGTVLEAMEGLSTSREAMGLGVVRRESFVLIVVPDLFMTIDYMEKWLGGLLQQNPRGRLLLVGSLGLPGTQWAKGEVLDAKTQAHGLSNLLWDLVERGELSIDPPPCVAIMGLGTGANAVLHFAGTFLAGAKFTPLRNATRFLAIVNPFPTTSSTTVESKQVKQSLQSLRRVLEKGTHYEQLQSLMTALFSAEFIQEHGREKVLAEFWLPRQNLELPHLQRPASAPTSRRATARGTGRSRGMQDHTHLPTNKSGILACVDGVLRGSTLGALNQDVRVPIVLITSTQDALNSSKTAEHCRASLGAEEVDSLFNLMSGNKNGRMMVYPVRAGREVLHEAQTRTLEILAKAIDAAQAQPVIAPLSRTRYLDSNMKEDQPQPGVGDDIGSYSDQRGRPSVLFKSDATENTGPCEHSPPGGAKAPDSSGVEMASVVDGHVVETETVAPPESAADNVTSKGRGRREFDVRKERAAERKIKSERLQKRRELDRLKRTQREEQEKIGEQDEQVLMQQEDNRSEAVSKYTRNMEEWDTGVVEAKERALELTSARDSKEKKVSEDRLAHDRADQHIQRVELFRQRKLDLLELDDGADTEPVLYGCVQNVEVGLARDACQKLLEQLLSLRQRVVKSMQVELLRRDQLANFESQYHKLETDLREAERQQRTYARGGAAANVLGEVPLQELNDTGASVAKQESQFCTFQSVLKERREMWGLAVSHMQRLKIAIRKKETEVRVILSEIGGSIDSLRKAGGRIHAKNEGLVTLKAGVEEKTKAMRKRANVLAHEQTLLCGHSGSFFDTDIWQPGVTQRMTAARFSQDIQMELMDVHRGIERNMEQIKSLDEKLEGGLGSGQEIESKMQKLEQIAHVTDERFKRMVAKSVVQELEDILDDEREIHRPDASMPAKSSNSHSTSLAETIRNKASHYRSMEEKQWVALDILVNREQYKTLSVLENEELQLNDEYKTEHRGEDVARILQLPHEIQLALPHLKSPAEIDAHKLLATYTLEHGDAFFAKVDEESQDQFFATASSRAQSTPVSIEPSQARTSAGYDALLEARLPTASVAQAGASGQQTLMKQRRDPTRVRDLGGAPSSPRCMSRSKTHSTGLLESSSPSPSCSAPMARDANELAEPSLSEISPVHHHEIPHINLFNDMSEVAVRGTSDSDGEIAVRTGEREFYRSASSSLGIHESRVHGFTILDQPPTYSVDLKVIVKFTGCIDARGFNRGRVRAILRRNRKYSEGEGVSAGECIGYSPHARQKLNIGDEFHQTPGTIVILHCPRRVPLSSGVFEVKVTALGPTEYSVVVVSGQCELFTSLVDKRSAEARNLQKRLDVLERELSETWQGVRLRERQYHVCGALVAEAQSECLRCQQAIDELCGYLRPHALGFNSRSSRESGTSEHDASSNVSSNNSGTTHPSSTSGSTSTRSGSTTSSTTATGSSTASSSELSETEREETWNEVAAIETEQMHWGHLFTTRCQEKASVKKALRGLMKLRRDSRAEKDRLETQLRQLSFEIPIVTAALEDPNTAAEVSRELPLNPGSSSNWQGSSMQSARTNVRLETPAEKIRRAFERGGWGTLTLEERQWVTVDKSLHPDKYVWLQQRDQEEAERKLQRGKKLRAKPRKNPAIDQCRFDRLELERMLAEPFSDLNRREIHVRKLVHKFHDDPQLVKTNGLVEEDGMHDYLLAQQTRLKSHKHRTTVEKEWISLDKILNPQVWKRAKEDVPGTRNDQRPSSGGGEDTPRDEQIWICPFGRDDLLKTWARGVDASYSTEDEKHALKLLTTYYGTYRGLASNGAVRGWKGIQVEKTAEGPCTDIDQRLRCIQQELDRVAHSSNPKINSSVLHSAPQRYPTSTLRLELEAEIDRLLREQVQQRERKNVYLIEDYSSSEGENDDDGREKKLENRRTRRTKRRASRGDVTIYAARKRLLLNAAKTPLQQDKAKRVDKLGPGGCPACMSAPCNYIPVVNVEATNTRLERIADELHFARTSTEDVIQTTLPLSVQRDGVTSFRRTELIEDLISEQNNLRYTLKLHFVDQELHETHRTSSEHFECVALHGYRTYLWTTDARVALEREHNRLIARLVATDIAHDILDWMLEGWHFGERLSRHKVVGYVPSVQKTGHIKAGTKVQDEPTAEEVAKIQEKEGDRVSAFTLPPGTNGSSWNDSSERVVKKGGAHDEDIGFMERTMHFGLFCIAIMYFRARWLLRQQRECASQFKLGWNIDTSVPVQAHRKDTNQSSYSTQAGHQRVKVRKQKEQAEVLADFAGFLTIEKREVDAAQLLQRIYRGHIGRKASNRWRVKRAEYSATNALMVSAAISIQRIMRGCWGRCRAGTIRAGIARWLSHLIDDEGHEFEAELLKTSNVEALKKGIGELLEDDDDDDEDG